MKLISARSSCAPGAHQDREARARDLRRALEVEDARAPARGPSAPSARNRRRAALPTCARRRCRRRFAGGHAFVRQVGNGREQPRALMLDGIELDLQLLDRLRALLVGLEDRLRIQALSLGARHFVAGRVLLALEPFELRDHAAALRFERRQLLELRARDRRRACQRCAQFDVVATKAGSSMRSSSVSYPNLIPADVWYLTLIPAEVIL